jgi:hypothetical protein
MIATRPMRAASRPPPARPLAGAALTLALGAVACGDGPVAVIRLGCQTPHVDPFQQSALADGDRSHWLQPWRAFRDTWPAARMRDAPAFDLATAAGVKERARAALYAGAGFRRAVVEIQWQDVDPAAPNRLGALREQKRATLALLRGLGIRPVILVDAHGQLPRAGIPLSLAASAAKGARQVRLDPSGSAQVVPGRTLLLEPRAFIRAVDAAGVATLTKPLPEDLPAGRVQAAVVVAPPFPRPVLPDGAPNPAFEEPMQIWLAFLEAVAREAKETLGGDAFDLLLWNGGGSPVLDANNYHDPPIADPATPVELTRQAILARTIAWARDARNGISGARLIDGFTNTRFGDGGAAALPGLDAYARHLAVQRVRFPAPGQPPPEPAVRWLDAAGRPEAAPHLPRYGAMFPELPLTALGPVQLTRDRSPTLGRDAAGRPRGRLAGPPAGPPPAVDVTAFAFYPERAEDGGPLAPAEARRALTKGALRALAAYVGTGAATLGFYENQPATTLELDGDGGGGETMRAIAAFLRAFEGPAEIGPRRPIALRAVVDCSGARQFDGDGTAAHPALLDRDLVAFFPFQVTSRRFVAPTYVMTRDLGRLHAAASPGALRTEPPERRFTLEIDGVRGEEAAVSAFDPISGARTFAQIVRRSATGLRLEVALTDAPRLIEISEP